MMTWRSISTRTPWRTSRWTTPSTWTSSSTTRTTTIAVDTIEILTPSPAAVVEKSGEAEDEEEEEEPEDEDVEASLDVILKERLVVEDEPEDEEATDQEDKSEGNERVLPKQPDEFVCRSCFLVKHPSQLADKKKMLCRDCV